MNGHSGPKKFKIFLSYLGHGQNKCPGENFVYFMKILKFQAKEHTHF